MSVDDTFEYGDFHFTVLSSQTCMIGLNSTEYSNAPISGNAYSGALVIPERVFDKNNRIYKVIRTSTFCFKGCKNIVSVSLPKTLRQIGGDSFYDTSVKYLVVPRSVEILDQAAFSCMRELRELVFEPGSKLKSIGYILMNSCHNIRRVVLPLHVSTIACEFFRCVSKSTEIDVFYCGRNEITNEVFNNGGNVTTYVTSNYPSSKTFGGIQPKIINDDTCRLFFEYEKLRSKNICRRSRCSGSSLFLFVALILS